MERLKDFPTDKEYFADPRYWQDFLNRQRRHRQELEQLFWRAIVKKDWNGLRNQMAILGVRQTHLKQWLLVGCFGKDAYDIAERFDWKEKCPPLLRELIMTAESHIPKWQRLEALFIIDMYHAILQEASFFMER